MRQLRLFSLVVVWAAVISCGDRAQDSSRFSTEAIPQMQQLPTDQQIDPSDTYVIFNATATTQQVVSYDHPVLDPGTGQYVTQIQLPALPATSYHIEAGYDYSGKLRTIMRGNWSAALDPLTHIVPDAFTMVLSNGMVSEFDAGGGALAAAIYDGAPAADEMLGDLGPDLYYGDILAGVIPPDTIPALRATSSGVESVMLLSSPPGNGRETRRHQRRRYDRVNGRWQLAEQLDSTVSDVDGAQVTVTQRLVLGDLNWHQNNARDHGRRGAQHSVGPTSGSSVPARAQCQEDCGGSPPPPPPSAAASAPGGADQSRVRARVS